MTTFCPEIRYPSPKKNLPLFPANGIAAFNGIGDIPHRNPRSHQGRATLGFR